MVEVCSSKKLWIRDPPRQDSSSGRGGARGVERLNLIRTLFGVGSCTWTCTTGLSPSFLSLRSGTLILVGG